MKFLYHNEPTLVPLHDIPADLQIIGEELIDNRSASGLASRSGEEWHAVTFVNPATDHRYYATTFNWWYMGEDGDAGTERFLFTDLATARRVAKELATAYRSAMNRAPKTYRETAFVLTLEDGTTKRQHGGKVGQYVTTIQGYPYIDGAALRSDGKSEEYEVWNRNWDRGYKLGIKTLEQVRDSEWEPYMLRTGKNLSGRMLYWTHIDGEPVSDDVPINFDLTPLGHRLVSRIPKRFWEQVRPTLVYTSRDHAEDYIEDCLTHLSGTDYRDMTGYYAGTHTASQLDSIGIVHNLPRKP